MQKTKVIDKNHEEKNSKQNMNKEAEDVPEFFKKIQELTR